MKKILSIFLAALLMFSLSTGVLAADEDEIEELVGRYTLCDMPGQQIPGMDSLTQMLDELELPEGFNVEFDTPMLIRLMSAMGMSATLEIREDGTADLDLFGSGGEVEFDFDTLTLTANGNSIQCTYEDGALTLPIEDVELVFMKEDPNAGRQGVYDYYLLDKFVDDDGEEMDLDSLDVLPALYVFEGGDAIMTSVSGCLPITFDYGKMTALVPVDDEEEEEIPFTLEDGILTMTEEEAMLLFRAADPGIVGPYAMTALVTEDQGDQTEALSVLSLMGLLPTFTIEENGDARLELFGTTMELLFDFDTVTVTAEEEDEELDYTYENGTLHIEENGNSMTFRRIPSEEELALFSVMVGADEG